LLKSAPSSKANGAAAYFRIREAGPSRQQQMRLVSEAARLRGLKITREFIEFAGIASGDIVDRRMTLFELLAAARSGEIGTVVIASSEAIADKPIEAAIIALLLERAGCNVIFADNFDIEPYRQEAMKVIGG
jgi:hypothetical protein